MKLVSNLLLITGVTALAEGIVTARKNGISDELLKDVLADSFVVSARVQGPTGEPVRQLSPWVVLSVACSQGRSVSCRSRRTGRSSRAAAVGPATDALLTSVIEAGGQWPDFAA